MSKKIKSIFSSTTFYGAVLSVYCSVVPSIKLCSIKKCGPADYIDFTGIAASTLMIIIGRYNAKAVVYTPDWLPGRSKKDLINNPDEDENEDDDFTPRV